MMMRVLVWTVLIIIVVMAVRSKLRGILEPRPPGPQGRGPEPGVQGGARGRVRDESERMSCCAQCGLYFPSSEAVSAGGREYCCAAHAHQAGN